MKLSLKEAGIIVVIREIDKPGAEFLCDILRNTGINYAEVSFTDPEAPKLISSLKMRFGSAMRIGAGTVITEDQLDSAERAGADYIVSPGLNLKIAEKADQRGLAYLPGVLTPSEIQNVLALGMDCCKIFPASANGPEYIKALKGPFPQVEFFPFGGMTVENASAFVKAGAAGFGIGSYIANKKLITGRNQDELISRCKNLKELLGA